MSLGGVLNMFLIFWLSEAGVLIEVFLQKTGCTSRHENDFLIEFLSHREIGRSCVNCFEN